MKYLSQNKYWEINKEYNLEKLLYLLIDRPNIVNGYNSFIWLNNKKQECRNYDLPSHSSSTGFLCWCVNGDFYRENNKPAYIDNNGYKEYWVNRYKTVK